MSAFVINPYVFAAGGLEAEYISTLYRSSINATTYTFTSESIGTADANRHLVFTTSNRHGFGTGRVTAISVGGSSCTVDLSQQNPNRRHVGVFSIAYPSNSTADIAVTTDGPIQNITVSIFRVISPALSVDSTAFAFGATSPVSQSIDVTGGGIIFMTASSGTGNASYDPPTSSDISSSYSNFNQAHGFAPTPTTTTETIDITHDTQVIHYGLVSYSPT
jgi:hypothetical protein